MDKITWDENVYKQFEEILQQIPAMIRGIAETRVSKKAQNIALSDNRIEVKEKDMVDAFFAETPSGFLGQMKSSMDQLEINYKKYGYN